MPMQRVKTSKIQDNLLPTEEFLSQKKTAKEKVGWFSFAVFLVFLACLIALGVINSMH